MHCILHSPPQPIGYTMGPAGDGSDYVNADLVTPENTNAEATINAVESGCPVDGIDKERNVGERVATTSNTDSEADADEETGGGLPSQKDKFDGIKGVIQTPKYKDLKYSILFILHFGIIIWWFVDSFIPYTYYYNVKYSGLTVNHLPLIGVMLSLNFVGLSISILAVGFFLRHSQTALKSAIFFSMSMCLGVGVFGLFMGEMFMCLAGFVAFTIVSVYANVIWKRIPFTAINLSLAISSIRENMGLICSSPSVWHWIPLGPHCRNRVCQCLQNV